jgi:hypothetical protein
VEFAADVPALNSAWNADASDFASWSCMESDSVSDPVCESESADLIPKMSTPVPTERSSRNDAPAVFPVAACGVAGLLLTALGAIRTPVYLHVAFQQIPFSFHRACLRKLLNPWHIRIRVGLFTIPMTGKVGNACRTQ